MVSEQRFSGIVVLLITTINSDEELDNSGLERLINHVIQGGVDGILY